MAQPYPGVCGIIRQAYVNQGLEENTINIMIKSLSQNTLKQYNTSLKKWFQFCKNNNVHVYDHSITLVLKFLTQMFENGANYGTLNSYRSALSLILGKQVGNDDCISRFLKGVFRIKPSLPKYKDIWNPNLVLEYLSNLFPNEKLSIDKITKKLVTLLALSTAQRVQTLSMIDINNICIKDSCIIVTIDELIKTSAPNRHNPRMIIPFFKDRESICPAKTLSSYLKVTEQFRLLPNTEKLILTTKKPLHSASSQSISRWIKNTLSESGINVNLFTAHSTRHASTSAANRCGVSIDIIKRTAGWTGDSLCFAKFYNQPLLNMEEDISFADAVCNQNND